MKGEGGQVDQDPGDFVPFWNESLGQEALKTDLFIFHAPLGFMSLPAVRNVAIPGILIKIFTDDYFRTDKMIVSYNNCTHLKKTYRWKRCAILLF